MTDLPPEEFPAVSTNPADPNFDPWPWCDERFPTVSDRVETQGFHNVDEKDRVLFLLYLLVGEVGNGGFSQYFFNSSSKHVSEAQRVLENLGATHSAEVVRRAIALFPEGKVAEDREERWDQLESIPWEKFEELDASFLDENDENLYELVFQFWTKSSRAD